MGKISCEIVTFEIAYLAKSKGFKKGSNYFPFIDRFYEPSTRSIRRYGRHRVRNPTKHLIYAPSHFELHQWLLKRKILIEVYPVDDWDHWVAKVFCEDVMSPFYVAAITSEFPTYLEAMNKGLFLGLQNLK